MVYPQPKVIKFQEHYRKLVKNRRAANKGNIAVSGISEEYGELEEVIDKIIEEVDMMKNEEKQKKEKEDKRQTKLKNAAEDIRRKATKRLNSGENDGDEEPKPKKKPRKLVGMEALGGMDPDIQHLVEKDKMRHENEAKRLQLEERRLALQEKQFERYSGERRATTELPRILAKNLKK